MLRATGTAIDAGSLAAFALSVFRCFSGRFIAIGYLIDMVREPGAAAGIAIGVWLAFVDSSTTWVCSGSLWWIKAAQFQPLDALLLACSISARHNQRQCLCRMAALGNAVTIAPPVSWLRSSVGCSRWRWRLMPFSRREL